MRICKASILRSGRETLIRTALIHFLFISVTQAALRHLSHYADYGRSRQHERSGGAVGGVRQGQGYGQNYDTHPQQRNYGARHTQSAAENNGCPDVLRLTSCSCEQNSVSCINGQITDTDIFLSVGTHFRTLESVTFHGNNFINLPEALFGKGFTHDRLKRLNLSANYIINVDAYALTGVPAVEKLDLSHNELVLNGGPNISKFFQSIPKLNYLALKNAFARPDRSNLNTSVVQLETLDIMFKNSKLPNLEIIDLSSNWFTHIPYSFACTLTMLKKLIFKNNFLSTIHLNSDCYKNLKRLDLSGNSFITLDLSSRISASSLATSSILLHDNLFQCDCKSEAYLKWVRTTRAIQDRSELLCKKASPGRFEDFHLIDIPIEELDCTVHFYTSGSPIHGIHRYNFPIFIIVLRFGYR